MPKFANDLVCTRVATPLGDVILAASAHGLAGLWFHDQRHLPGQLDGSTATGLWRRDDAHPVLQQAARQLAEYFAGQRQVFDVPLDLSAGTSFQRSIWEALLAVESGDSVSYAQLAQRIGHPQAVRATGAAVGRNPLSIFVPCHRALGKNGALTGYAGGLARKTALLQLEGHHAQHHHSNQH